MSHYWTFTQLSSYSVWVLLYLGLGFTYATWCLVTAVRDWAEELSTSQRFAVSYYWLPAVIGFFVAWLCWPYALYLYSHQTE